MGPRFRRVDDTDTSVGKVFGVYANCIHIENYSYDERVGASYTLNKPEARIVIKNLQEFVNNEDLNEDGVRKTVANLIKAMEGEKSE